MLRLAAAIGVFFVFLVIGFLQGEKPVPAAAEEKPAAVENVVGKTKPISAPVAINR
jgi:hypothetical protein